MSGRVVALVLVIVVFGALSGLAVREVGYFGIVTPLLEHWGGRQVLVDRGRFVRALFYLVARELRAAANRAHAA